MEKEHKRNLTRRSAIGLLASIPISVAADKLGVVNLDSVQHTIQGSETRLPENIMRLKSFVKERYNVEVQGGLNIFIDKYEGTYPDEKDYEKVLTYIIEALDLYPKDILRAMGLKIRVFNDRDKSAPPGFYLPYKPNEIAITAKASKMWAHTTIHHELFHFIDYKNGDNNSLNREFDKFQRDICSCSPYSQTKHSVEHPLFGSFERMYGQNNPEEDRATFAEMIMNRERHLNFVKRVESDVGAISKINLFKYEKVKSIYEKWSGGAMNEKYWHDFLSGKDLDFRQIITEHSIGR